HAQARAADARAPVRPDAHRLGGEFPEPLRGDAQPGTALPASGRRAAVRAQAHAGGAPRAHLPAQRFHAVPLPPPALGAGTAAGGGMRLAERYTGKTVLAVGAHADDVELAVGGTIARLRRGGARVVMVVVSLPGDYKQRMGEAKQAAEILGCELRVLMTDSARRIEDLKSYELVAMIDREV